MTTSNTGDNRSDQGRFKKGDPRINRKGRPKSFDTFRREAIKIAGEIINDANGVPLISRANAILMDWALSKDPQKQKLFVEYAFGKVPEQKEITGAGGGAIEIRATDYRASIGPLRPLLEDEQSE